MNCPGCGAENLDTATFCSSCGTNLSGKSTAFRASLSALDKDSLKKSGRQDEPTEDELDESPDERKSSSSEKNSRIPPVPKSLRDGRYRIDKKLGAGGMGRVFLAFDTFMEYHVVIKEMLPFYATDEEREYLETRFKEEAKILFRLKHLNLPRVTDGFTERGSMFLVMEYIEGEDLEKTVSQRPFTQAGFDECMEWLKKILDLLSFLHNQDPPIIHRDIKPANLMLTREGEIYLVDFGVARPVGTQTYTRVGSPGFASMEHMTGHITPASDLFSLGATIHFLLSGESPAYRPMFQFPTLSDYRNDIPDEFQQIIDRMLEINPADRYQTAEELKNDLTAFLEGDYTKIQALMNERAKNRKGTERIKKHKTGKSRPKVKLELMMPEEKKTPTEPEAPPVEPPAAQAHPAAKPPLRPILQPIPIPYKKEPSPEESKDTLKAGHDIQKNLADDGIIPTPTVRLKEPPPPEPKKVTILDKLPDEVSRDLKRRSTVKRVEYWFKWLGNKMVKLVISLLVLGVIAFFVFNAPNWIHNILKEKKARYNVVIYTKNNQEANKIKEILNKSGVTYTLGKTRREREKITGYRVASIFSTGKEAGNCAQTLKSKGISASVKKSGAGEVKVIITGEFSSRKEARHYSDKAQKASGKKFALENITEKTAYPAITLKLSLPVPKKEADNLTEKLGKYSDDIDVIPTDEKEK